MRGVPLRLRKADAPLQCLPEMLSHRIWAFRAHVRPPWQGRLASVRGMRGEHLSKPKAVNGDAVRACYAHGVLHGTYQKVLQLPFAVVREACCGC